MWHPPPSLDQKLSVMSYGNRNRELRRSGAHHYARGALGSGLLQVARTRPGTFGSQPTRCRLHWPV
jgi:hypothetical protein